MDEMQLCECWQYYILFFICVEFIEGIFRLKLQKVVLMRNLFLGDIDFDDDNVFKFLFYKEDLIISICFKSFKMIWVLGMLEYFVYD